MAACVDKENPTSRGHAWFCTSGLPSDVVVQVDEMKFHLHKFPLVSKSGKLDQLLNKQDSLSPGDENDEKQLVAFRQFPGGPEAFETAAKFCYGAKIDLDSGSVVAVRCAAEYLEMTEEFSKNNLIAKTELFFMNSVFNSLASSAVALKSCEKVLPMAETLGLIGRCIEYLSSKASFPNTAVLGWPVAGAHEDSSHDRICSREPDVTWMQHVAVMNLPLFKRLVVSMKTNKVADEAIESCLMHYAGRNIPVISRNKSPVLPSIATLATLLSESEQLEILEVITKNLPSTTNSPSSSTTRIMFGLLRTANILNAPESVRSLLEKKVGNQLDHASLDDLLIPSYSYLNETLYDVDCVERIVDSFNQKVSKHNEEQESGVSSSAVMVVGKLVDDYLAEIASDSSLKPEKFCKLAMTVPERARVFDDGLYRAVDVFLKAHPRVTEIEREKVCSVLDYQKLTLEACTHAAQNDRLPIRSVVQVLFFEQLQLRNSIAGEAPTAGTEGGTWRDAVRESQVLRLDMNGMRTRVLKLERECSSMKRMIARIERKEEAAPSSEQVVRRRKTPSGKFGCKFKTLVCDSHQTVGRRSRRRSRV